MDDSNPGFDRQTFDGYWKNLDEQQRKDLVLHAPQLPVYLGLLPILSSVFSTHYPLREVGKKSLTSMTFVIRKNIETPLENKPLKQAQAEAFQGAALIYRKIFMQMAFSDKSVLIQALMNIGNVGAFFAFKAIYLERVSQDVIKNCIKNLDDRLRLTFADQYLQANPAVRLRFAGLFRYVLAGVKQRQAVTWYYAGLFDRGRDVDPYLNNIDASLRNPLLIEENELLSPDYQDRIAGLKAISMMRSKVPLRVFKKALAQETVKKIRMAVYGLIENSSFGLYPELFEPVLQRLQHAKTNEAVSAFKALVVTGRHPFHKVMEIVRNTNASIIPIIHMEISALSRLSFFALQDIALNKDAYQGENYDINLACIFGMIKKRPERVVRILKENVGLCGSDRIRKEVDRLMVKTQSLLLKERKSIAAPFKDIQTQMPEKKSMVTFFKSIFKDPVQKKLDDLKQRIIPQDLDLEKAVIRDLDLSGLDLTRSVLNLTHAQIVNTLMTGIHVSGGICRNTLFYNMNLNGAVFDLTCFDNAVFVNVSAQNTKFSQCSFQNASFYNCNFNGADMSDALFIEAIMAKSSFNETNLTCAVFAHARLSGLSFANAWLHMADFTNARARFCRFASHAAMDLRTRDLNYNDREYQLSFNDLPRIDPRVVNEINMLIFCEFIHFGQAKFLKQNKLSLLAAFDIFKPEQADFFQLLPLLLHENIAMPETSNVPSSTPCGVADYLPSREVERVGRQYLGGANVLIRRHPDPCILAIYSMGSVGSVAQTAESDIDYWICIDEKRLGGQAIDLLRRKFDALEGMALDRFKIQVTFFLVDIFKARDNDFGGSSQESSGSAQARLLKEEFYRTMIHVAGRLPLWTALPTSISINYYNLIFDCINRLPGTKRYIDLGDIHAVPRNEYFGASIWQMFKWLKSPFKSVIKMALLEKYINTYGREPMLCNEYKNEWMNSGTHLKPGQNDSYIILLNTMIQFYMKSGDTRSIKLLLTCFFLKLGITKQSELDSSVFGLRRILLGRCLREWEWTQEKVFEIGRFKSWPYAAIHRLSLTIEQYMITRYTDLKSRFRDDAELAISEQDRMVLERKVDIQFQDKPGKIKKLLLISSGDRHFSKLYLRYLVPSGKRYGQWELIHKPSIQTGMDEESILTANSVEEIGAWLIHNHLYTDHTFLTMAPNPTEVSHDSIEKLYRAMYDFFTPELAKSFSFDALKKRSFITSLFISVNFYAERPSGRISDFTLIYLNSWEEMFLRTTILKIPVADLEPVKKHICTGLGLKQLPENTVFHVPRRGASMMI
ncbi:adenylate cyclase [Desulfobacter hydrogenophilus]|uniref:Adenylate cyclase n=1 Tax=Desulfobacter hydrogenophilus TaxID=2291 RepID=A0A328FJD3_9BACT|nr:class I adenylate cyclase [Desulfobacter hydrogenophilus]NDY70606.1 adenylate cyclase [Desulfobacter hydrogenophilus]QBH13975.1 adenylate cyclase [Desulfobacter hydrogenophilus]RAM03612.1 adenylate cyclase [Desulfobacter hydrogenophilus]